MCALINGPIKFALQSFQKKNNPETNDISKYDKNMTRKIKVMHQKSI